MRPALWFGSLAVASMLLASACGGDSPSSPSPSPSPSPAPVATTTITITAAGTSPRNITVTQGSRVTFTNNDTRVHEMTSDPHPIHTDCPELNDVGFLQAGGQSKTSGNLNTIRTCGYHDHLNDSNASLRGTITITAQ